MPFPSFHAPRPPRRGFTLIEIMVVIGIIVLLAGIGLVVGIQVRHKAQIDYTNTTLKALSMAMSNFLQNHPEPTAANWLQALQAEPKISAPIANLKGMPNYVEDGFGNKILFVPSTDYRNWSKNAVFQSVGPNGKDEYGQPGSDDLLSQPVVP